MKLFNRQKKTEEQKSAMAILKHNLNHGIEEKELGAFYERFCQFENALGHYRQAHDFFVAAGEMAELAGDADKQQRVEAYKALTSGKILDMQECIRIGIDGRSR